MSFSSSPVWVVSSPSVSPLERIARRPWVHPEGTLTHEGMSWTTDLCECDDGQGRREGGGVPDYDGVLCLVVRGLRRDVETTERLISLLRCG